MTKEEIQIIYDYSKSKKDIAKKLSIKLNQNKINIDKDILEYFSQIGITQREQISKTNLSKHWLEIQNRDYELNPKYCLNCGNIIPFERKLSNYCCTSCGISNGNKIKGTRSEETKRKISIKKTKLNHIHICKVCNKKYYYIKGTDTTKKFCSHKCFNYFKSHLKQFLSESGKIALHNWGIQNIINQGNLRRSKNEIEFCNLCENYFNNVEHNKPIFNGWDADIIIHDIKFAILWNGKWHYEKITKLHSVEQTQNRDKIKIEEISKYGYIPYIIKDMGKYNLNFVHEEFNKLIQYIKDTQL